MQMTSEQIKEFAIAIKDDIRSYLEKHRVEYAEFLENINTEDLNND